MTPAEQQIRETLPYATPGRWKHVFSGGGLEHYVYALDAHYSPYMPGPVKVAWLPYSPGSNRDANDAAYIAACSPENIDAVLAEIDRLRAAVQHEADCVEASRAKIERLTRALDATPSAPDANDIEWAGKVHLVDAEATIERLTRERDEARAEREALRAACKTTLMLRQLGGMMPGTKAVIDVAIHHAEEALAQIEQEKANGTR